MYGRDGNVGEEEESECDITRPNAEVPSFHQSQRRKLMTYTTEGAVLLTSRARLVACGRRMWGSASSRSPGASSGGIIKF